MSRGASNGSGVTRRDVLRLVGGATAVTVGTSGAVGAQSGNDSGGSDTNVISRKLVVPAVERFAGNYAGQFVVVTYRSQEAGQAPSAAGIGDCDFASWPVEETAVYTGLLVDRLKEEPDAVRVSIYADGRNSDIRQGQPFIVDGTSDCPGEYVGLTATSIPATAAAGSEPLGPTVAASANGNEETTAEPTESEGQAGFGAAAAGASLGGAALLRRYLGD